MTQARKPRVVKNAGTATPKTEKTVQSARHEQLVRRAGTHDMFDTLHGKLARSLLYYKHHTVDLLQREFRFQPHMMTVDIYYPSSHYGELFIDQPNFSFEIEQCRRKAAVMKAANKKYVIIEKDSDLENLHQQVEGDFSYVDKRTG